MAQELAEGGVTVVSGLAGGIDTASHRGCMNGGGITIGVQAGGLEQAYPTANARLRKELLEGGGLVLSEYPP